MLGFALWSFSHTPPHPRPELCSRGTDSAKMTHTGARPGSKLFAEIGSRPGLAQKP